MSIELRGFCTLNFYADDMPAARAWYTEVLGAEPYFEATDPRSGQVGYYEWRLGDHQDEFGIINGAWRPPADPTTKAPGGAVMNWHVDDLDGTVERLVAHGATVHQPRVDRTQGFANASVVDPFGNIIGLMFNPHWKAMADGEEVARA
jgi:predicted enzyme related to lactoylglutathione lyase